MNGLNEYGNDIRVVFTNDLYRVNIVKWGARKASHQWLETSVHLAVAGRRPRFDLKLLAPEPGGSIEAATTGTRRVYVDGAWHEAAILTRLSLPVGARVPGPAILEQPDTTILIEPGLVGEVDAYGNVLIGEA